LTDARKRKLHGTRIDLGRRTHGAPRLTCAVIADRENDGRLDAVVLTGPASIDATISESGAPNGGTKPSVAVSVPERVTDHAVVLGPTPAVWGSWICWIWPRRPTAATGCASWPRCPRRATTAST
jgi:hypothetical protein